MKQLGRYAVVGFEFAGLIVAGFFIGRFLDRQLETSYLTWLGLAVGAFAGFRTLFRMAKLEQLALEKEDREQGAPPGTPSEEEENGEDAKKRRDHDA